MPDSTVRDILVLAAHPDLARSHATRTVLDALRASPAAGRVDLRDLYRLYPDFHIHIDAEQRDRRRGGSPSGQPVESEKETIPVDGGFTAK